MKEIRPKVRIVNSDYSVERLGVFKCVKVKIPNQASLTHFQNEAHDMPDGKRVIVPAHYHNGMCLHGGVWINRRFEGIRVEDAGKERIFDITLEKKDTGDGRWFVQMILVKTDRVIAKHKMSFLPRYRADHDDDIQLEHTDENYLRVEAVQMYHRTCCKCSKRIQMTHKPNPKFDNGNYIGPCCMPRKPREKKSKEQRQRESGLRELQELKTLYNRMGH